MPYILCTSKYRWIKIGEDGMHENKGGESK